MPKDRVDDEALACQMIEAGVVLINLVNECTERGLIVEGPHFKWRLIHNVSQDRDYCILVMDTLHVHKLIAKRPVSVARRTGWQPRPRWKQFFRDLRA